MINLIDVAVVVKWKGLSLLDPMIKVEEEDYCETALFIVL
tara:strand:- start:203 stop:322 length:120 start_codon:yes stop_codon:yes gene_type:complete